MELTELREDAPSAAARVSALWRGFGQENGAVVKMYAGSLASAAASLAVTELAKGAGVAGELNPALAPTLANPPLAYSVVAASITAAFLLLGATLRALARLQPSLARMGHLGYVAVLAIWVVDATRNIVLIASGRETLALIIAVSVGSLTCLAASKRLVTRRPTI